MRIATQSAATDRDRTGRMLIAGNCAAKTIAWATSLTNTRTESFKSTSQLHFRRELVHRYSLVTVEVMVKFGKNRNESLFFFRRDRSDVPQEDENTLLFTLGLARRF